MTRRLVLVMTAVAALVAVALAVPMVLLVANDQRAAFVSQLEVETLAAASVLASQPDSAWPATVEDISAQAGGRVVVVDDALVLVADSDNSDLDRSFDRPEVQSALEGSLTSSVRFSDTLGADLRYVAAPVIKDERVVAAVRLSLPETTVSDAVRRTQLWLGVFVIAVIIAAGLMLVGIALFGSISAIVTSKLILPKETKDHEELRREVRALHADIRELREELKKK